MCGLWSFSLFLIIAVFLSICPTGNSQTGTEHDIKCQGSVVKLKCLNKSYIITIVSVFYGRTLPGSSICRSPPYSYLSDESSCSSDKNDVTAEVKEICKHKTSCNFTLKKETFGKDGCPNIYKYMDVEYSCDDIMKVKKNIKEVIIPANLSSSVVIVTSTITSTSTPMTSQVSSTEAIQPTSTLVANVDRLITIYQPQTSTPRSSSLSSSRPHSVSVTTVSHTERLPTTSVAATIERPSLKTTKPASKTYENSATSAGQHGTMKLFRFILSFHIIHEESIHKHTASSVVWFMFGLLVGLFIMIAVLVYYRVKQVRRERKDKPNKAAYIKQKNCTDGTLEEKVILHPKELEALEMESQLGETV